ncbi:MAG: type I asparaginase [Bacteroidaceae bacterium]|nr:type I asparaginase [Bacteroidaceae bacterium]MCF0186000.1 type I asparaginase [Bacteroidaceae bacterium]
MTKRSVLLIYTGGTIGMVENKSTGTLEPFDFNHLLNEVPELQQFNLNIGTYQFNPPIDSSDMVTEHWVKIARIINSNYQRYDGFVVLHGTDTMAYTASALSFMLENLSKPVVLTGSQLPIGTLRTDGKENLITAIEIAADYKPDGTARVPEVCVFFDSQLMRGNRTTKISAEYFQAFASNNYPTLAHANIHIRYATDHILKASEKPLNVHLEMSRDVFIFSLFPGIQENMVRQLFNTPGLKGVVMRTFGSGNAPQKKWLMECLKEAIDRGLSIVNVTQCSTGAVEMERYDTGLHLSNIGVISGHDSTVEAALTKLMFLIGQGYNAKAIRKLMQVSIAGEITL